MPSRLVELQRQRALVVEHLRWLEREVAQCEGRSEEAPTSAQKTEMAAEPVVLAPPPVAPADHGHPDLPSVDHLSIHSSTRKGCFLYFALAMVLVAGCAWLLVWFSHLSATQRKPSAPTASESSPSR